MTNLIDKNLSINFKQMFHGRDNSNYIGTILFDSPLSDKSSLLDLETKMPIEDCIKLRDYLDAHIKDYLIDE